MKRESRAPLIVAIVLLLLPVPYVGSYLALVKPAAIGMLRGDARDVYLSFYRFEGRWLGRIFWPLEQIDRKVRPGAWNPLSLLPNPNRITIGDDGLERIGVDFD